MHQLLDHDGTYSDTASEILWVSRQLFAAARQELGHLSERQDRLISNNHWHHDSRLTTLWCRSNSVPSRVSQAAHWIKNDCPSRMNEKHHRYHAPKPHHYHHHHRQLQPQPPQPPTPSHPQTPKAKPAPRQAGTGSTRPRRNSSTRCCARTRRRRRRKNSPPPCRA